MDKGKLGVIVAVGVLALGTIGGFAVRAGAATPASPAPAAVAAASDQNTAADVTEAAEPDAGLPDTDQIQEEVGDQNADDATEAADETKAEADGPGGHADEPGNANADHQFEGVE